MERTRMNLFQNSFLLHPGRSGRPLLRPLVIFLLVGLLGVGTARQASAQPSPPTPEATIHVVQAGDTLSQIAANYGIPLDRLMALNGLDDPDAIYVGQKLRLTPSLAADMAIPPPMAEAPVGPGEEASRPPIATLNRTYQVQAGDTLHTIALRAGVDEAALARLNDLPLDNPGLAIGQILLLPATPADLREAREAGSRQAAAVYVVQAGDTLGGIAQAHGLSLADLLAANRIAAPDAIYVGQQLTIPPRPEPEAPPPAPLRLGPARNGFFYYTVRPGDTLSGLARDFDSTVLAVLEYNDLPDAETVYTGLELRIPFGPPPLPLRLPPVPLSGTRFLVSLSRQQCWLLRGEAVAYSWPCSTGYGAWITRTGTFQVQTKLEMAQSNAYQLDMPYWLGIYDVGSYENGIHGLPVSWETGEKIWEGLIGQPATFGCAMLTDEDAAILFQNAYLGMPVHIVP
uniref:LysM peptidoglycan-binding domain-containing protein n=2 Tax=Litorilinea aerophila TaxID=1204385 RepID=A0A540VH94_9CHLR